MHKFVRNLLTEWRKLGLPFEDETFVVAISGGADSVALALALDDLRKRKKLNLRFVLAHFNHDLRGAQSDADADFVDEMARKIGLELVSQKGKVTEKGNLEQNARLARYEFLRETAENLQAYGISTAHTANDQAETFLLNLIRGSGIVGLAAMKPSTANYDLPMSNDEKKTKMENRKAKVALVRPLLRWATREETEDYCRSLEIEYRNDSMNEDLSLKRVRIRKILLPLLKEFNPKIVQTLAKTASLLQTESEEANENETRKLKIEDRFLLLKDLRSLSQLSIYRTLRGWLKKERKTLRQLDLKHMEAIERLIFSRKSGKVVELPNGERVFKERGKLYWKKKNIENIE